MPVEVYDNLIAAVRSHLPSLHRYMRLSKRALGLDELHMYDLYTPIVGGVEMKVNLYGGLRARERGPRPARRRNMWTRCARGFASGWVDVYENRGKTSGAYSWGVWGTHPYVLLNWNDTLDNAFTLAHEFGHAMHSFYLGQAALCRGAVSHPAGRGRVHMQRSAVHGLHAQAYGQ